jgi:hypothetical protein
MSRKINDVSRVEFPASLRANERRACTQIAHAREMHYPFASAFFFDPRQNLMELTLACLHPTIVPAHG